MKKTAVIVGALLKGALKSGFAFFASLYVAGSCFAEETEVDSLLVEDLGAGDFSKRAKAQAELLEWVKEQNTQRAFALKQEYEKHSDPEVKERVIKAMRELFVAPGQGYLGVNFRLEFIHLEEAEPQFGLLVTRVVRESPAALGGIQIGDFIYEIGGWRAELGDIPIDVQTAVQRLPVGEKTIVRLFRKEEDMGVRIRLAQSPDVGPATEQENQQAFWNWFEKLSP